MKMLSFAYLCALLSLTSAFSIASRQSSACNNSPDLCSKSYSSITHLGAHDSPFIRDAANGFTVSGNQFYNTTTQLSAGVRLVTAQVHSSNGGWHLCHTSCDLIDAGTLSSWLSEIKEWLDANPNEVITILLVNSDNASVDQLHQEFSTAQIDKYGYKPPSTTNAPTSWPTLQELISQNTRMVTFVASLDTSSVTSETSYLMNEFNFVFENAFSNTAASDFKCVPDRPSGVQGSISTALNANLMPLVNHFLDMQGIFDIETPNYDSINTTNSPSTSLTGSLGTALTQCTSQYNNRQPVFTLVDFFDMGPAIQAVDAINGVTSPVGRTAPPSRDTTTSIGDQLSGSFSGVQMLVEQVKAGQNPGTGAWIWGSGKWSFGGLAIGSSTPASS